eukprot:Phypoly_transcript_23682.p1 GENE.Phypoly_transcript_23682~~Phypoly_transcript_23682.p1  ORF type:complete len:126 (+),score=9.50 Phypoly_transcript_23682:86-463(+)
MFMLSFQFLLALFFYAEMNGLPFDEVHVRSGWLPLLQQLVDKLVALGWDRRVSCIKEKFGELRIYGNWTAEQREVVSWAELESATTCEMCGGPGENCGENWIFTLCAQCDNERKGGAPSQDAKHA